MEISKLHLTNFLSYEQASLNLKDRGLVLIQGENRDSGGSNGSGKSSLFDAILFCLFGKTSRYGSQNSKVSRNGAGGCVVCCELNLSSGNTALVYRHRDHEKYGNKLLVYVDQKDLTRGSDAETQKVLEDLIGLDYEVFQSVVLFAQGASGFASMTDAGQKYILESILGTERFTVALERAKTRKKELELSYQSVKSGLFELDRTQQARKKRLEDLKSKETSFAFEKEVELSQLAQEQTKLQEAKPHQDPELLPKVQALQADISSSSNSKSRQLATQTEQRIREVELEKARTESRAASLNADLTAYPSEEPARPEYPSTHYQDDLSRLQTQVLTLELDLRRDQQTLEELTRSIGGVDTMTECSECGQPLSGQARKRMMGEAGTKRGALLIKVGQKDKLLKELVSQKEIVEALYYGAQVYENWENGETKRQQKAQIQTQLDALTERLEVLKTMASDVKSVIADLDAKTLELNKLRQEEQRQTQAMQLWETKAQNLALRLKTVQEKQSPYLPLIEKENSDLELGQKEYTRKYSLYSELDKQIKIMDFWIVGFSPRGVRSLLLDECTPLLNERAAEYLNVLTDESAQIEFSTVSTMASGEQKDKFNVEVSYANGTSEYKGCSGGERRRVDIATIFALGDLAASRASSNVDLRLLDEPFESLDSLGNEKVIRLLREKVVPRSKTVLVMSHDEDLKSMFENRITVIKENGISRIEDNGT